MRLSIGIKSDPIQRRYSYEWLFNLMNRMGISYVQLGSFFEMPLLDDEYFYELREKAREYDVRIKSLFSAHREVEGFYVPDPHLRKVARKICERYIHIASILGADYAGTSPGCSNRDRMDYREKGIEYFISNLKELMHMAKEKGLKGLSIEIMSCAAEPPATPQEISRFMNSLLPYHTANKDRTVPVYLLGDISHGYADAQGRVIYSNYEIFEFAIPYMNEFHIKNTDGIFNKTFGFSEEEIKGGCVDLSRLKDIIEKNRDKWPVEEVTGYLEHLGPKVGRDYTDFKLEEILIDSLKAVNKILKIQ
ncbi:MAG: sugar phosphate isomerase/epimerase family protein [Spirochaetota bacterium]